MMRRTKIKAVVNTAELVWQRLAPEEQAYRQHHLCGSVSAATDAAYEKRAARIQEIAGSIDYPGFCRYMRITDEEAVANGGARRLRSSTLRQHKSSVLHVNLKNDTPWSVAESIDVDAMLASREGEDSPKIHRGQLDWPKICAVRAYAESLGHKDVADAFLVVYAACLRGQDIEFMTADNCEGLDTPTPYVWSIRKSPAGVLVIKVLSPRTRCASSKLSTTSSSASAKRQRPTAST
jgi:hypothetical protein